MSKDNIGDRRPSSQPLPSKDGEGGSVPLDELVSPASNYPDPLVESCGVKPLGSIEFQIGSSMRRPPGFARQ